MTKIYPIIVKKVVAGGEGQGVVAWQPPFHGVATPNVSASCSLGDFELEPQVALFVTALLSALELQFQPNLITATPSVEIATQDHAAALASALVNLDQIEAVHSPVAARLVVPANFAPELLTVAQVSALITSNIESVYNAALVTSTAALTALEAVHDALVVVATPSIDFTGDVVHNAALATLVTAFTASEVLHDAALVAVTNLGALEWAGFPAALVNAQAILFEVAPTFNAAATSLATALPAVEIGIEGPVVNRSILAALEAAFNAASCSVTEGASTLEVEQTFTATSTVWVAPTVASHGYDVTSIRFDGWGGGGGGGPAVVNGGGGGKGGSYARNAAISVVAGSSHTVVVHQGGAAGANGGPTSLDATTVVAAGGNAGLTGGATAQGAGGSATTPASSTGTVTFTGGNGGGGGGLNIDGGAGGGGAGDAANGTAGTAAGVPGAGGSAGGGAGGGRPSGVGVVAGGGGCGASTTAGAGAGGRGQARITYTVTL